MTRLGLGSGGWDHVKAGPRPTVMHQHFPGRPGLWRDFSGSVSGEGPPSPLVGLGRTRQQENQDWQQAQRAEPRGLEGSKLGVPRTEDRGKTSRSLGARPKSEDGMAGGRSNGARAWSQERWWLHLNMSWQSSPSSSVC